MQKKPLPQAAERRWRETELSMQKAFSLLNKTTDFEGKEELRSLLLEMPKTFHSSSEPSIL